ncbi:MAG: class I SAM-dependent methyltransferase [Pseudomonadota bacterium]|nr:class I SAM-dependent methyltransferase [Pseudomonadota bacterium]|tara:strand:- start:92 stop:823 length:732 start_codon:yes stop_codon:yes gene_type:complete
MTDPLFQRGIQYQQYRPTYPPSLFQWLADCCRDASQARALDLGCGTGQAARALEPYFKQVIGADISLKQLQAAPASKTHFLACQAHQLPLAANSVALITVAQAFHWFEQEGFFTEAERCLRPGGVLALISYGVCEVEGLGALIRDFHDSLLARWWPAERTQVVSGYAGTEHHWPALPFPDDAITRQWSATDMLGYLDTWSALVNARKAGEDPLGEFRETLLTAWGEQQRTVRWPLRVKAWRKP